MNAAQSSYQRMIELYEDMKARSFRLSQRASFTTKLQIEEALQSAEQTIARCEMRIS